MVVKISSRVASRGDKKTRYRRFPSVLGIMVCGRGGRGGGGWGKLLVLSVEVGAVEGL